MKKFSVLLLLLLCKLGVSQQPAIHPFTLTPVNPNSNSQIKIATHLETPYWAFLVDKQFTVNVLSQSIDLHLCYANGMSPAISHHVDTFAIGVLPAGTYSVKLNAFISSAGQHCAKVDSNSASFTFTVSGPVGVNEKAHEHEVKVFPNPAGSEINVEAKAIVKEIRIFSVQGQLLRKEELSPDGIISLHGLSEGIYFLELSFKDTKTVRRITVK